MFVCGCVFVSMCVNVFVCQCVWEGWGWCKKWHGRWWGKGIGVLQEHPHT